jgi:hypothetical protein
MMSEVRGQSNNRLNRTSTCTPSARDTGSQVGSTCATRQPPFRFALKPSPPRAPNPLQKPFSTRGTPPPPSGAPISPQPFCYGPRCPCSTLLPRLPERLHYFQNPQIASTLISKQWTAKRSGPHAAKARYERLHGDLDCLGESCDIRSSGLSHEGARPSAA